MTQANPTTGDVDLLAMIAGAKARLCLYAYEVRLERRDAQNPDDPDCDAECITSHPYLHATLVLYPSFFTRDIEWQRHILLHELAHIITRPYKSAAKRLYEGQVVTWQEILDRDEHITDWVARIAGTDWVSGR